jgi:hypothetical protein
VPCDRVGVRSALLVGRNVFDEEYIADGFGANLGAPAQVSGGIRVTL